MAFKILSPNEIELLTESQRNDYEKELAVYNERVKFVEQMERFEDTVIKPYEPKLVNVLAVGKIPEKSYSNPEYAVTTVDIAVKPIPKTATVNFDEPVTAVVPKYSKIKNVSVEHIKKSKPNEPILPRISKANVPDKTFIKSEQYEAVLPQIGKTNVPSRTFIKSEQDEPLLPQTNKLNVPAKAFVKFEQNKPLLPERVRTVVPYMISRKTEQVRPNLPTAVKLQSFAQLDFSPVPIDNESIKVYRSNITPPAINLPEISLPEKIQPILPKTSVKFSDVKAFKVPEQTDIVFPKAVIPKQVDILFKRANKTKAQLPKVSNISAVNTSYIKPDIRKAELPTPQKVVIPAKKFAKSKYAFSDLPTVAMPKAGMQSYTAPEIQKSILPKFIKPVVSSSYAKPQVNPTLKIKYSPINIPHAKSFKKFHSKINRFPKISAVSAPDAYKNESLKNLLQSNRENKT